MVAKKQPKIKFNPWFFFFGVIGAIFILKSWQIILLDKKYENKTYPNVYIDNIEFSGKTKKEIQDYYDKKSKLLKDLSITVIFDNQPVATLSGSAINVKYDSQTAAERAFLVGRSNFMIPRLYQKFVALTDLTRFDFISNIDYDKTLVSEKIDLLKDNYDFPAKNALFKFENGRVANFRKEEKGREIIKESFLADFDNLIQTLKNKPKNIVLTIKPKVIEPEITLTSLNDYGIEELVAEGRSDFSHSIAERVHNVILAASKFNGVLIPPGKTFSFNETIGDISSLTGYKPAYIIKEGKTVLGDGGGVCQVSTTLFRAALNAGLPIIERYPHAYRVIYYENDMKPGYDATVFSPTVDLKIKNDTPAHILIETEVDNDNNLLYFRFYGKKDERIVEVSDAYVWDVAPPPEARYQEDPTLKKGIVKQVDFPAWGGKSTFNYKVYKKDKLVIDQKFYSSYRPWQAVYLVGSAD